MTPEEKAARARQRKIEKSKEWSPGHHRSVVAKVFQQMVRAEAALKPAGHEVAVVNGVIATVWRNVGECVCVTCGQVAPWTTSTGSMQTGHFLASRCAAILFEESGVAPQCVTCNDLEHGAQQRYRMWMEHVRGPEAIERLVQLKNTPWQYSREELVDLHIAFAARLKRAKAELLRLAE